MISLYKEGKDQKNLVLSLFYGFILEFYALGISGNEKPL